MEALDFFSHTSIFLRKQFPKKDNQLLCAKIKDGRHEKDAYDVYKTIYSDFLQPLSSGQTMTIFVKAVIKEKKHGNNSRYYQQIPVWFSHRGKKI